MGMFGFFCAGLAEEGQCDLAHRVECRQEGSDCQCEKDCPMAMPERICENFILRPKTSRNQREARQSKATDKERPERDRHLLAQAAHIEHILWVDMMIACVQNTMLHAMNDGSRA